MKDQEPKIIGNAYRDLKPLIRKYAQKDFPVLFIGETGSGKELFADLCISSSPRVGQKRKVNCAAFSDSLLRSEVFGYVKGAFTDAKTDRDGFLRRCKNGILFLDELGDASAEFQAAILRVTEGHPFSPVGSEEEFNSNTLIIAATDKPDRIREELKQRFHVLPIPPLQKFDIPALAKHFLGGKNIKQNVLEELIARDFPGNVRELERYCQRLQAERGDTIFNQYAFDTTQSINQAGVFDYERFRSQISIWDKWISPIVHKYGLNYRYKYFPPLPPPEPPKGASPILRRRNTHGAGNLWDEMPVLVRRLLQGEGDKENLQKFMNILDNCFNLGSLDFLDLWAESDSNSRKIKPELIPLLDMKFHESLKEYEAIYLKYHLQIHNWNRDQTASEIGIPKKTLNSRLLNLTRLRTKK